MEAVKLRKGGREVFFARLEVGEDLFELDSTGFCIGCGAEVDGIEPDVCKDECERCGESAVYGVEELALMGYVIFTI